VNEIPILYRDAALVAVSKPPGLLVHRTMIDRHETRFALQLVRDAIGQRVWPVHRLDKGTSGVLLFALSERVASKLGSAYEAGDVDKRYIALVRGWPPAEGCIDHPLTHRVDAAESPTRGLEARAAQPATTDYVRLGTVEVEHAVDRFPTGRYALVELAPRSGRRHQLRRHLKHIAHPIIGDATYGKGQHNRFVAERVGAQRLWLHAASLILPHPETGGRLAVEAPLDWQWERLNVLGEWCWEGPWRLVGKLDRPATP
jgi:tRNA pseudouridine65 synthase